jgi:cytochrome c2
MVIPARSDYMIFLHCLLFFFFSGICAVDSDEGSPTRGEKAFYVSFRSRRYFTPCYDCHNITENSYAVKRKPGPPLADSRFRETFKSGRFQRVDEAVADCMEHYQLRFHEKDLQNILAFLGSVSQTEVKTGWDYGSEAALPELISGDMYRGQVIYENSCYPCHKKQQTAFLKNPLSREFIFQKVRGIKPDQRVELQSLKDVYPKESAAPIMQMPVFVRNRLCDEELADVAEFVVNENRDIFDGLNIYPPADARFRTNFSQRRLHRLLRKLRPPQQLQPR